jgi:N6-adenosine-specific RNA methylase IME4
MTTLEKNPAPTLTVIEDADAAAIGELYRRSRTSIIDSVRFSIECGTRLHAKKDSLPHGTWLPWLSANADVLRFESRFTAAKLMGFARKCAAAAHFDLNDATAITYSRQLWGHDDTDVDLDNVVDHNGELTTRKATREYMRLREEARVAKAARRAAREIALADKVLALPKKRYGVILADPEWKFEVYSDAGMSRSAENHYPTSALDAIKDRDAPSISADHCVLFLWATVPMLPDALEVMSAWGFDYKSSFVWVKDKVGTGYWNRNQHELLLIGTRGDVPAPAPGTQFSSVIKAKRGKHSEKPVEAYELIEEYFPTLPKIELNARQRRPGWDAWGLEAPATAD